MIDPFLSFEMVPGTHPTLLKAKPKLLEREEVYHQIEKQFTGFVEAFYMGM